MLFILVGFAYALMSVSINTLPDLERFLHKSKASPSFSKLFMSLIMCLDFAFSGLIIK